MTDQPPGHVYKYLPDRLDRIGEIVANKRLFFSSPLRFNDPFDCATGIRFPDRKNLTKNDKLCLRWILNTFTDPIMNNATNHITTNSFDLLNFFDKRFFSDVERMSEQVIKDYGKTQGIFCVSETMESLTMWAHYAANHRGVVIEFDFAALFNWDSNIDFLHVDYKEPLPSLYEYKEVVETADMLKFGKLFYCRKSPEWENEKEWRLFTTAPDTYRDLPKSAITRIIFGTKMPDYTKKLIQKWVQEDVDLGNIVLSDAALSNSSFKVIAKDRRAGRP